MKKQIHIRESGELQHGGVDESTNVVRNVKLLGENSLNKRRYLPESVNPVDYDHRPVYLNHPDGNKDRDVRDKFGWIENPKKVGDEWRGDLHYNPKHPFAEQFSWLAANAPSQIGLSHDAVGQGHTDKDGTFIVDKVVQVKSVDLVATPATTKGLFESQMATEHEMQDEGLDSLETHIKNAVGSIVSHDGMDHKEKCKRIKAALKLLEPSEKDEEEKESEDEGQEDGRDEDLYKKDVEDEKKKYKKDEKAVDEDEEDGDEEMDDEEESEDEEDDDKVKESLKILARKNKHVRKLIEKVDMLVTKDRIREKTDLAHRLCQEAKLPSIAVSVTFLESLINAKNEAAMKELIKDRKALATVQKPRSSAPIQESTATKLDTKSFAKQLKG